ncbi:nitrogen fixation protein NifQ [Vibrio diazotrophicus]|uniref:nitrogen fixation protein NifQ n=1 Tax=Vibrio diazotrophicus TaxID=685 RepID=UPI000C9E3123|nr:nitrogen fixation protein NifQ [Vibrio diazotrophicus]PNH98786.1 nitrogen fixation protein NifQ [Vibrio diazotrophicus]
MMDNVIQDYWQPILENYQKGQTALPLYMGLNQNGYDALLLAMGLESVTLSKEAEEKLQLRLELMNMRIGELEELERLLVESLNPNITFGSEMVTVLASACLGSQHLWRDLGMPERPRLTALFRDYFPLLHAKNVNNMRWKRFLYRQLCENGGDYVCRSPSCEECASYSECYDLSAK